MRGEIDRRLRAAGVNPSEARALGPAGERSPGPVRRRGETWPAYKARREAEMRELLGREGGRALHFGVHHREPPRARKGRRKR